MVSRELAALFRTQPYHLILGNLGLLILSSLGLFAYKIGIDTSCFAGLLYGASEIMPTRHLAQALA